MDTELREYQDSYLKTIYRDWEPSARLSVCTEEQDVVEGGFGFRPQAMFPGDHVVGGATTDSTDPTREAISQERSQIFESKLPTNALIQVVGKAWTIRVNV